jgi:hypothetical protein
MPPARRHWRELAILHANWMLAQIVARTSDSDFDAACKAVVATVRHWQQQHSGSAMPLRQCRQKHRQSPRDWDQILGALQAMGAIEAVMAASTGGRPGMFLRVMA